MDGYTPGGNGSERDYGSTSAAQLNLNAGGFGRLNVSNSGLNLKIFPSNLEPINTQANYRTFGELIEKTPVDPSLILGDIVTKRTILRASGIERIHVPGTTQVIPLNCASDARVGTVFKRVYHNYQRNHNK